MSKEDDLKRIDNIFEEMQETFKIPKPEITHLRWQKELLKKKYVRKKSK